jgi:hypothetical protein
MAAFSPSNAVAAPDKIGFSDFRPFQERKSLLSVLKGLDEVPPEIFHPEPTKPVEIDILKINCKLKPMSGNLIAGGMTFADPKSANCITRPKLI